MTDGEIETLEAQLRDEPRSSFARSQLLLAYLSPNERLNDPRRIEHILWYVQNDPRRHTCRSPMVQINPEQAPEGYREVEGEWLKQVREHPGDATIIIGLANCLLLKDHAHAIQVLEEFAASDPTQAEVWFELGRVSPEPAKKLHHLLEARHRGSTQPNLLPWLARTAEESSDFGTAESVANEMLALVEDAQTIYGERLDWVEHGAALFAKAAAAFPDPTARSTFTTAKRQYAEYMH